MGHPKGLGCGAVFLGDFFAFAGEGPLAVEGLGFFADGFGDIVDLEVFEDVDA
jgi:hypothetical protein